MQNITAANYIKISSKIVCLLRIKTQTIRKQKKKKSSIIIAKLSNFAATGIGISYPILTS